MDGFISPQDFGLGGYNQSSLEQALNKALETGYAQGVGRTGGSTFRVESLESSLKALTFTSNHIKLWKKIPKSPAFSTVEEYNQVTSYGGESSPFISEGELPQSTDASFVRQAAKVKFMGTVREVTHQATLVHSAHGDLVAAQNQTGILWMLQQIEKYLFSGDDSLAFSGESHQWRGLDNWIDPTALIDLAGQPLQEADLEQAAQEIVSDYGFATDVFLGMRPMSDLVKTFYPKERVQLPAPMNGQVGQSVNTMATQAGILEFNPNVFIQKNPAPPAAATSASAPATPTSIAAGAVTGTDGDFTKGSAGGTTYVAYVVTACNRFGESAPTAVGSAVTLTQANKLLGVHIPLTVTNPSTIGAFAPEYFRIYRSADSSSSSAPTSLASYSLIAQVPASSQSASGTTTYNDVNLTLPFTSTAYVGELTPQVLTFRQLMPLMKVDMAMVTLAYRWAIVLYGTPILFAPKKWRRLINIGDLSTR